jgi:hypothetical protein
MKLIGAAIITVFIIFVAGLAEMTIPTGQTYTEPLIVAVFVAMFAAMLAVQWVFNSDARYAILGAFLTKCLNLSFTL